MFDQPPGPLSCILLSRLLTLLGVRYSRGKLEKTCSQPVDDPEPVIKQLHRVLSTNRLKGIQPVVLPWRRFDQRRLPALVWNQNRWWLVERHLPGQITLTDEQGAVTSCDDIALQNALVLWLRVAKIQPTPGIWSRAPNPAARLVWRELRREKGWLTHVLIATLVVNVLAISVSLFAMQVYDRVVPTLAYATLWTLVSGMGVVFCLDWTLKIVRARIIDSVATAVDKRVSQQVFDHIMHLQLDLQPRSLGTLAAQVGGLDAVRQFFSSAVVFALVDLPFALLFIAIIALIGGPVSMVYLLLLPLALLMGLSTQIRLKRLLHQQMIRTHERQGLLVDAIRGSESIRANNATWRFSEEWQAITQTISRYNIRQKAISNFSTVTTGTLSSSAYVSAVVVGVDLIASGRLSMGGLIACSILGGRIIAPVAQSVQHLVQWQNVVHALRMVNQVLQLGQERRSDQTLLMPETVPDCIELEQIRYTYPESPVQQLKLERLQFKAGERVLLLGPVGCGKSTLLKVMAGLYRPAEGRVRLGACDLWEMDPQLVATHIGYLPQSVHLFKGSLKSNLMLSGVVSDARLAQIARELGIDDIAAGSPMGMELPISEGGEGLSGGQRQLLALGRVVIAQPRIWLLDEPTASLDNESETRVLKVIAAHVRPEDILVFSTHRPLLAANLATRVVVMQQGEIIKDGRPDGVLPQHMGRGVFKRIPPSAVNPAQPRGVIDAI